MWLWGESIDDRIYMIGILLSDDGDEILPRTKKKLNTILDDNYKVFERSSDYFTYYWDHSSNASFPHNIYYPITFILR